VIVRLVSISRSTRKPTANEAGGGAGAGVDWVAAL
jgi:hypothetical protein